MRLEKLYLLNFKNYAEASLEFTQQVNCLLGLNGSGKTNLLDAIYYLAFTKSFLPSADTQNVRHGSGYFLVKGTFDFDGKHHEVTCQVQPNHKKIFREDSLDYDKISDHIGKYPVVMIAPSDVDLVKEGSEARRKFFDSIISQIDHAYLETLLTYQHVLKQRNGLLRLFQERQYSDPQLLESYDDQLVKTGLVIFKRRQEFIAEFLPVFNKSYAFLVDQYEEARLFYRSALTETDFADGLRKSFQKDLMLQRTSFGIHRDDYEFEFAHGELKKLGSQGQQKSFLVAIKLAHFEIIRQHKGFNPILLLDDIFDKLDDQRIARLLSVVAGKDYGQLFITDAGPERTMGLLKGLGISFDNFRVENGQIGK
jgi:DNA replication and repair protein RecF